MDQLPAARKKYLKLDDQEWEQVRSFVDDYFEQPEKAAKATYAVLFREISQKYPHIVLEPSAFTKHIASIEKLKAKAGIQTQDEVLSKEYRKKLNDIFHQILIGLPLHEFESIKFEGIIQRAHTLDPNLGIIDKNRKTLAKHFPIKQLKSSAREQRPAAAAESPGHSRRAAEVAQALAAAANDVPRRGEIQGQREVQDGRFCPQKRLRRDKDVWEMSSDPNPAAPDEEEHIPRAAVPSPPAAQDAAIDRDIHATGAQLAARDGPNGATNCLLMLCEYNSENPSSNTHTEDGGQPDCSPARDAGDHGTCISCLIFGTFRY